MNFVSGKLNSSHPLFKNLNSSEITYIGGIGNGRKSGFSKSESEPISLITSVFSIRLRDVMDSIRSLLGKTAVPPVFHLMFQSSCSTFEKEDGVNFGKVLPVGGDTGFGFPG
jgi:hypothetical protein